MWNIAEYDPFMTFNLSKTGQADFVCDKKMIACMISTYLIFQDYDIVFFLRIITFKE